MHSIACQARRRWALRGAVVALVVGGMHGLSACQSVDDAVRSVENSLTTRDLTPPPVVIKDEPDVRVRIARGIREARIDGPARMVVRSNRGAMPVSVPGPLRITSNGEGLQIRDGQGQMRRWPFGSDLELLPQDLRAPGGTLGATQAVRLNEVAFAGILSIRPQWHEYPEQIDVIATMGVESYLPGVLAKEMPVDWSRQALEAQAVVSRTYALHDRERAMRDGRGFDVEDETPERFRAVGYPASILEAVSATRGMALTLQGRLVRSYYSSTCGGRPASAAEVWGTGPGLEFNRIDPLQGKARRWACERSPDFRWESQRRVDEVSQRLRAWGQANNSAVARMTRVRSITIEKANEAKRPSRFRIADDGGREFVLSAEELRAGFNQNVSGLPAIDENTKVRSADAEFEVWADLVKVRGRGSGHGVGMCQHCARGFGDQGWDWRMMMREFFPGADATKLY